MLGLHTGSLHAIAVARLWEDGLPLHVRPLARAAGWDLDQRRVRIEPGRTLILGNGMDTTGKHSGLAAPSLQPVPKA